MALLRLKAPVMIKHVSQNCVGLYLSLLAWMCLYVSGFVYYCLYLSFFDVYCHYLSLFVIICQNSIGDLRRVFPDPRKRSMRIRATKKLRVVAKTSSYRNYSP